MSADAFRKLASEFIGLESEFDVILKVGRTADSQANGQAWYRGPNEPIEIMLNEDRLGRSALEVARTIVHEMIHAEIYRALNIANPTRGEIRFRDSFEAYANQFYGNNDIHHNYMADFWVDNIGEILQNVHPSLGFSELNDYLKSWAYPDGIPKEFYNALAWDGLKYENVKAWINKNKNEKDIINEHIEKAKYGTKNCNN